MKNGKLKGALMNGSTLGRKHPKGRTALLNEAKEAIANGESSFRKAAEALVELRDEYGMSQRELAEEVGRSQPWINRLLRWYERECKGDSPFDLDHANAEAKKSNESNKRLAANRSSSIIKDPILDIEDHLDRIERMRDPKQWQDRLCAALAALTALKDTWPSPPKMVEPLEAWGRDGNYKICSLPELAAWVAELGDAWGREKKPKAISPNERRRREVASARMRHLNELRQ